MVPLPVPPGSPRVFLPPSLWEPDWAVNHTVWWGSLRDGVPLEFSAFRVVPTEPPAVPQLRSGWSCCSTGSPGESPPPQVRGPWARLRGCVSSLGDSSLRCVLPLAWAQGGWLVIQSVSFLPTVWRESHLPSFLCVELETGRPCVHFLRFENTFGFPYFFFDPSVI